MKLIHCADLHLDSPMRFLPPELAKIRRGELLQTFLRMVGYAEREEVKAILIAGDLFDRKRISAASGNVVLDSIRSHPDIIFFYVTGNHERDGFIDFIGDVPENLKLFGDRWRTYQAGRIAVTGMDPCTGQGPAVFSSPVLDPSCFNIVLLHGQITEYAEAGGRESIPLRELCGKPVDYLALGHVHAFQEGAFPPRAAWCYPGALEGRGFDECGEHGFVLLDIDEENGSFIRTFVPFAARKLQMIPVDITGCLTTPEIAGRIEAAAGHPLSGEKVTDDFWEIVLTGQVDISCEKETDWLRRRFGPMCGFLRIEDRTSLAVDYRDYVRDASLKGEFVRLVAGDDGLDEQEKAEIIRCGIRALSGEEMEI